MLIWQEENTRLLPGYSGTSYIPSFSVGLACTEWGADGLTFHRSVTDRRSPSSYSTSHHMEATFLFAFLLSLENWGVKAFLGAGVSTAEEVFVLHAADPVSIPDILHTPLSISKSDP